MGDCNGKLMFAHTAYREAEVAVNHMRGIKDHIDYSIIPSVIYTTPEVACVGVYIIGSYASEIIYGAAAMVYSKLPVQHLDKIVFPHPTACEVIREALFML